MNCFSYITSRLPSVRTTLATAMAIFTLAAAPLSQTLAVARVESADNQKQNSAAGFKLVVVSAWDETADTSDEPNTSKNENKPARQPSLLRPLSDQWDTAKVVQFSADVPAEITPVRPGSVALIEAQPTPQPVFAPPHTPIRPGRAPPQPA